MTPGNKKRKIEHWHVIAACLTIYDVIAVNAAYLIALWLRFDCAYSQIPKEYLDAYFRFAPVYTVFSMLVFRALRLYKSMWRFASYDELLRVFVASVVTFAFHTVGITAFLRRMPVSYYLVGAVLQVVLVVAVRFGNVLGSNGSVIPLFQKQIAKGGPVTVTHPDIIRYFMTIPEAVSLVLQAGYYARGGEKFVLDMGSPVRIDTLARNLIKLSGYKPDVDIRIEYTGLRPGEKLYEEKLMAEEGLKSTPNHLIHVGQPTPLDVESFLKQLEFLAKACYENREDEIRKMVAKIVPTYHPEGQSDTGEKDAVYEKLMR